jgi:hypothetical protein
MEHVTTEIEDKFINVIADDGYWLTQYNEKKGEEFYATKRICTPLSYVLEENGWRVITDEEYQYYNDNKGDGREI